MENAESRRFTVRLTKTELRKFYRYDMMFTPRAVWNIIIIIVAVLIYLAVMRTFIKYISLVWVIGVVFFTGLLYNLYCVTPTVSAEKAAPGEYGILDEFEFFGTYFNEKKGSTFITVPYNAIDKMVEFDTAFYLYFSPQMTRVQKISEDGGLEPVKNRSAVASVIVKEGLTEEEIQFIKSVVTPKQEVW